MSDEDKEKLMLAVLHREVEVDNLLRNDFVELLNALQRMYFARVWNCVDASAKNDPEWLALSDVFGRLYRELKKPEGEK